MLHSKHRHNWLCLQESLAPWHHTGLLLQDRLTTYHLALAEGRDEDLTNQVESWEYHSDRGMANGNLMQVPYS